MALISESPRWLLTKNKFNEAVFVLETIARGNGKERNQSENNLIFFIAKMKMYFLANVTMLNLISGVKFKKKNSSLGF